MRFIGLDVHRDWCDVAIYEDDEVRSAGREATKPDRLELFAQKAWALMIASRWRGPATR